MGMGSNPPFSASSSWVRAQHPTAGFESPVLRQQGPALRCGAFFVRGVRRRCPPRGGPSCPLFAKDWPSNADTGWNGLSPVRVGHLCLQERTAPGRADRGASSGRGVARRAADSACP